MRSLDDNGGGDYFAVASPTYADSGTLSGTDYGATDSGTAPATADPTNTGGGTCGVGFLLSDDGSCVASVSGPTATTTTAPVQKEPERVSEVWTKKFAGYLNPTTQEEPRTLTTITPSGPTQSSGVVVVVILAALAIGYWFLRMRKQHAATA